MSRNIHKGIRQGDLVFIETRKLDKKTIITERSQWYQKMPYEDKIVKYFPLMSESAPIELDSVRLDSWSTNYTTNMQGYTQRITKSIKLGRDVSKFIRSGFNEKCGVKIVEYIIPKEIINQYYDYNTLSYHMIRIEHIYKKITTTCNSCHVKGFVSEDCYECGGKGIRKKTIHKWQVQKRGIEIDRIVEKKDTKYYIKDDGSESYYLESDKLIFFTKEEAQKQCDKNNKER